MLHCLRISSGRASFCSRCVRTYKYTLEQQSGSSLLPKFFSGFRGLAGVARAAVSMLRVLTGQFNPRKGIGVANTSLAYLGAHPKKDPETGEMFAFRWGLLPPFLTYFVLDADGTKRCPDVPIFSNMRRPSFMHDFAITKKYALFCDMQLGMSGNIFRF
ncbi:hypothetical protein QJS10_CPB11g00005 [Acorus calamus]|uniref:Uncharacterized protein n=1 Tax=Acorus calamus TaxID=4465 RepID=A0AAV9DP30_ACOCL|nr:hypothetical protein QJS10_CPB11g00005 [Acorus calamus]